MVDVAVEGELGVAAGAAALEVWRLHYPRLAGWCAAGVGDEATGHDVAAEAFVRLLARWRKVEDPKPFLYATAMNLLRDHWRALERDRKLSDRLAGVRAEPPLADNWIRDLAARLPERLRGPVVLHYGADLAVDEVAVALGRPAGTIKRQLAEGRALLQTMLGAGEPG